MKKWLVYLFLSIITLAVTYKDSTSLTSRTSATLSSLLSRSPISRTLKLPTNVAPLRSTNRLLSTTVSGRALQQSTKPFLQQSSSTSLFTNPIQQQGLTCPPSSNRELRGLHSFSGTQSPFVLKEAYTEQQSNMPELENPSQVINFLRDTYFYDYQNSTFNLEKLAQQGKKPAQVLIELANLTNIITVNIGDAKLKAILSKSVKIAGGVALAGGLGELMEEINSLGHITSDINNPVFKAGAEIALRTGLVASGLGGLSSLLVSFGLTVEQLIYLVKYLTASKNNAYEQYDYEKIMEKLFSTSVSNLSRSQAIVNNAIIDLIKKLAELAEEDAIAKEANTPQAKDLLRAHKHVLKQQSVHTILGANEKISNQDLEFLYKKWLLQHHPDKYTYSEKLKKIANEVLMYLNGYFRPAKRSNLD